MEIKAINFDFYGTIMDWLHVWKETALLIVKDNGLDIPPKDLALEWRKFQREAIQSKGFVPYEHCIEEGLRLLAKKYDFDDKNYAEILYEQWKEINLFPEVGNALRNLKSKYKIAVCTNSSRRLFDYCAEKLPVKFDYELLSDETKITKPHTGMYAKAVQTLRYPIESILHVASSTMDVKGAGNFGLKVCWINRLDETLPVDTKKPWFEIKRLDELFRVLEK